mmetsp:Transcript_16164/g.15513  ORF Transcript_16164/g.15513 Transcript_16164/m.15513 type:complete len:333 (-) Transcript_16164:190-1188(-)
MKINLTSFEYLRKIKCLEISKIKEIQYREKFKQTLFNEMQMGKVVQNSAKSFHVTFINDDVKKVIDGSLLCFLLHCEARIASSLGLGFYTIGPCGEELLGAVALNLRPTDAVALHYRHTATSLTRQLISGKSIAEIAMMRARSYVCSTEDPITGGKHCSIGGSDYDYIVTSTLASQAVPAVGRALAIPLSNILFKNQKNNSKNNFKDTHNKFPSDAVSYVSVGEGSVNNAHFLTALNLAKYAQHRSFKCPIIFGISDNNKCISLEGFKWIQKFVANSGVKYFIADGTDMSSVYSQSKAAVDYARKFSRPTIILFENLPRRFGHAATDRQVYI